MNKSIRTKTAKKEMKTFKVALNFTGEVVLKVRASCEIDALSHATDIIHDFSALKVDEGLLLDQELLVDTARIAEKT